MNEVRAPLGLPKQVAEVGRTLVMGVLNVTPDSFSDGGRWADLESAVTRGRRLVAEGADIVDVGGESTRPGAQRVTLAEEVARVIPVVRELVRADVVVSVDTMRAEVADAALAVGASIVNDVSGGLADEAMAQLVAEAGVPYVVMHWRGHSDAMQQRAHYDDVVQDVVAELGARVDALTAAGVDPTQLVLDPGLGFAKDAAHNWRLLGALDRIVALGHPVLVAASRKRFLGALLATESGPLPPERRDAATAAISALAAAAGAWCVRVHEVGASHDAVRVAAAWSPPTTPVTVAS